MFGFRFNRMCVFCWYHSVCMPACRQCPNRGLYMAPNHHWVALYTIHTQHNTAPSIIHRHSTTQNTTPLLLSIRKQHSPSTSMLLSRHPLIHTTQLTLIHWQFNQHPLALTQPTAAQDTDAEWWWWTWAQPGAGSYWGNSGVRSTSETRKAGPL